MADESDEDLGLTKEERRKLRRGMLQSLAKAAKEGNASAAKAALDLLEERPVETDRDTVLAWLAAHPGSTAADAVDHFWPAATGHERSRRLGLVRQWLFRVQHGPSGTAPAPAPADGPAPAPPSVDEFASLPRVERLRRQLAALWADLASARARDDGSRIAALDARVERIGKLLDQALAEAGASGDARLDRSPVEVAAQIDRRERVLELLRRAGARS